MAEVVEDGIGTALQSIRDRASANSGDIGAQLDLELALDDVAQSYEELGDTQHAHRYYLESLAISRRLAASDPANVEWQRDLSISLEKLGDIAVAQGDLAGALRSFTKRQTIAERLAASDPANAEWQRDLAVSHFNLSQFAEKSGDEAMQRAELRAGFDIFAGMKERGMHLSSGDEGVLAKLRGMFGV